MINTIHGMPYQPVGNLLIEFPGHENYTNYYRDLDISKAVASVSYKVGEITFQREIFSSLADQVIILRLSANKPGQINCYLDFTSPQQHQKILTNSKITVTGITTSHDGVEGKLKFCTLIEPLVRRGNMVKKDSTIEITMADEVIIYISTATNFVNYKELSVNEIQKANTYLETPIIKEYARALTDHIIAYQEYFNRVELYLGETDSVRNPTDQRIIDFKQGNDPQLADLYFQFGRYLLISSSQPGGQPANLQGIWNHRQKPPWESKYTLNINCEMNYWPAEVTNLSEMHQPLFSMIKDLSVTGMESASILYDARGWVVHHNTDIWRFTGIIDRATYGMWQSGSSWLTQHLWQHYLYTGDTAFLLEYYPVMKSAAQFYVDELVREPETGYLVIGPSNSPENKFRGICAVSAGTTMDNQLMFDLFSNVIRSSKILNMDKAFADTLVYLKTQLPPMQIGQYSQLQEWMFDWDDTTDHHRHVSHLYGLYPGNQISPYRTPFLFQAAKQSLLYRGDESTGWSMGWKVNLWARLLDGNHAYKLISDQLSPALRPDKKDKGGTYFNLLDAHPPFQIDGNFGCTAGMAEMLVQSHDGAVHILPALPDQWEEGYIERLRARGCFTIDIKWSDVKPETVKVYAALGGNLRLRSYWELSSEYGNELKHATGENKNPFYALNPVPDPLVSEKASIKLPVLKTIFEYDIPTEAGKTYTFAVK